MYTRANLHIGRVDLIVHSYALEISNALVDFGGNKEGNRLRCSELPKAHGSLYSVILRLAKS